MLLMNFSAVTSAKLLKGEFLQNNLEKKEYSLARCFPRFYFGTPNPHAFKLLVKVLLLGIFEAVK